MVCPIPQIVDAEPAAVHCQVETADGVGQLGSAVPYSPLDRLDAVQGVPLAAKRYHWESPVVQVVCRVNSRVVVHVGAAVVERSTRGDVVGSVTGLLDGVAAAVVMCPSQRLPLLL